MHRYHFVLGGCHFVLRVCRTPLCAFVYMLLEAVSANNVARRLFYVLRLGRTYFVLPLRLLVAGPLEQRSSRAQRAVALFVVHRYHG